jgi:biotin carboxyl carrier protein
MDFTYQHGGKTYTLTVEPQPDGSYKATMGEKTVIFRAQPIEGGGWLIDWDGARSLAYVAAQGSEWHVHVNGHSYTLTVPDTRTAQQKTAGEGGSLTAQMPGQVIDVRVRPGDAVEKGQTLVVLEAMKMEIRIGAPTAGTVKRVLVNKSDVVERGQLLVEIDGG